MVETGIFGVARGMAGSQLEGTSAIAQPFWNLRRNGLNAARDILVGALGVLYLACPSARAAAPAAAGPITFIGQITMQAGAANGSTVITKTPKGFELVIQTISVYRSGTAAGSVGQLFLQTTLHGTVGYFAVPEAVADGAIYPAATLSATIYCGPTTPLLANAYRSGSDTAAETDNIIVTGYYVAIAE